jgi:hypothetical protein
MTKDDIIKLAKAAGFLVDGDSWIHAGAVLIDGRKSIDKQLKNFAALVAAHKAEVALAEAYRCGYKDGMKAHERNQELLKALKDMGARYGLTDVAREAIANAEGENT